MVNGDQQVFENKNVNVNTKDVNKYSNGNVLYR